MSRGRMKEESKKTFYSQVLNWREQQMLIELIQHGQKGIKGKDPVVNKEIYWNILMSKIEQI